MKEFHDLPPSTSKARDSQAPIMDVIVEKKKQVVMGEVSTLLLRDEPVVLRYTPKSKGKVRQPSSVQSEVVGDKAYRFNPTQKTLKEKGFTVESPKTGFGYSSPVPVRIKINRVNNHYVSVEDEAFVIVDKLLVSSRFRGKSSHVSVFDMLGPQRKRKAANHHQIK
ncbi:hypothetical protein ACH5RR_015612 [Cinchona calisaya]|uniref:Uncharacterized protein n=1 Tax=Cinchona calisaya TaxID=153742 RepID=A0ABD2ZU11_9GENT